jgi:hypothetical protein
MSLSGVTGAPSTIVLPRETTRSTTAENERTAATVTRPQVERPTVTKSGLLAPRQEALPVEAPAGTDPDLWQVLTHSERAYFAKMSAMGPLTYGRASGAIAAIGSGGETSMSRGGRLDVKG